MRSLRKTLLMYSLSISFLATLVILGVALRPAEGWLPQLQNEWNRWFNHKAYIAPYTPPTPNEPTYQIRAVWDEGQNVVRGELAVQLPEQRLDELPFYLYAAPGGSITVRDVKKDGQPVAFDATAKMLTVHTAPQTTPLTISFAFETRLPSDKSRTGVWRGVATVSYWHPVVAVERDGSWMPRPDGIGFGDPYLMDNGRYVVQWNTPAHWKWYTTGKRTSEVDAGNGRVIQTYEANRVRNFALVGGPGFHETSYETGTGTTVYVATTDPNMLSRTVELARSATTVYADLIGRYPYPVLNVLELPHGTVYAHELPNLALFARDLWSYDDPEHWITHEIAHGWFYNAVGNYETETPWLDEGLADYSALLEAETRRGKGEYVAHLQDAWQRFKQYHTYTPYRPGTPAGVTDGVTAAPYGHYPTSQAHYYYNYLRPVLMYHDLRKVIGDEAFFKFLRQYYVKNVERTATRADLEQALQDVAPDAVPLLKLWLDLPNDELIRTVSARFGG